METKYPILSKLISYIPVVVVVVVVPKIININ